MVQATGQEDRRLGLLVGRLRVSTSTVPRQLDDLRAAGCAASVSARPGRGGSTASPARSATLAVIASQRSSEGTIPALAFPYHAIVSSNGGARPER